MPASPETAAAMTTPAQHHHPAGTASEPPAPGPDTTSPTAGSPDTTSPTAGSPDTGSSAAGSADTSGSAAGTDMSGATDGRAAQRRELSAGAAIALFGGLMTTMVGVLAGLMMWQFDSLDDRINTLGTELRSEMDTLETGLRGEIGGLRSEMDTLETSLRGEIATLGTELRGEIGDLRSEMQAGFREVNATLLDHTDRLARLEASVDAGG